MEVWIRTFRRRRCNLCEKVRGSLRLSDRNIHHASSTASLLIRRCFTLRNYCVYCTTRGNNIRLFLPRTKKKGSIIVKISFRPNEASQEKWLKAHTRLKPLALISSLPPRLESVHFPLIGKFITRLITCEFLSSSFLSWPRRTRHAIQMASE